MPRATLTREQWNRLSNCLSGYARFMAEDGESDKAETLLALVGRADAQFVRDGAWLPAVEHQDVVITEAELSLVLDSTAQLLPEQDEVRAVVEALALPEPE